MITLRTSPFDLLDRLEQQVSQAGFEIASGRGRGG